MSASRIGNDASFVVGRGRSAAAWRALAIATCLMSAQCVPGLAAEEEPAPPAATGSESKIRSDEDGWLDLSEFLDESYGFVPLLIPITEPAVGYGAAGALVFLDRPTGEAPAGLSRPNITAAGGFGTQNGTWGLLAGDVRQWHDNRLQTVVGAIYSSVNLDFYGVGEDAALKDDPLSYNLEPTGGAARARYRLGDSHLWAGLTAVFITTDVTLEESTASPELLDFTGQSDVGGLVPSLTRDSRDNILTPTRGTYCEGSVGLFAPAFGSDDAFQRVGLTLLHYRPLHPSVTLGVRGGATLSFGDTPFYLFPFITLRGAPVLRYQGEQVVETEIELRWQFWKRFSLIGFVGGGATWSEFEGADSNKTVLTGGTGFRYELARKYGLHAGLDVGFGPDVTALYVQFGSAWARP